MARPAVAAVVRFRERPFSLRRRGVSPFSVLRPPGDGGEAAAPSLRPGAILPPYSSLWPPAARQASQGSS